MTKIAALLGVLLLAACATPEQGIVPGEHGTYLLQKTSAEGGHGQIDPLRRDAFAEATAFCARSGLVMEKVEYQEVDGKTARVASLQLLFQCVPGR